MSAGIRRETIGRPQRHSLHPRRETATGDGLRGCEHHIPRLVGFFLDLRQQQFDANELASDLRLPMGRQRTTVTGLSLAPGATLRLACRPLTRFTRRIRSFVRALRAGEMAGDVRPQSMPDQVHGFRYPRPSGHGGPRSDRAGSPRRRAGCAGDFHIGYCWTGMRASQQR
jgi:hypothetical protein